MIAELKPAFHKLEEHSNETSIDHRQFMSGIIGQLYAEINQIQSYFKLNEFADGNNLLDWERGSFQSEDYSEKLKELFGEE